SRCVEVVAGKSVVAELEHCLREAGAGGSNPLTPTSFSAKFCADPGADIIPMITERDANIRYRLAPRWHRLARGRHRRSRKVLHAQPRVRSKHLLTLR